MLEMIEFPDKPICLSVGIPSTRDSWSIALIPSTRDHEHAAPSTRGSYGDKTKHYMNIPPICANKMSEEP